MADAMDRYMTLRQAALVGPYSAPQIRRKIRNGTLLPMIHYTTPHRSEPLLVREAYLAFLTGQDAHLRPGLKPSPKKRGSRPNWDLVR